jgi:hypothetical protein
VGIARARTIVVDDAPYRWLVSERPTWMEAALDVDAMLDARRLTLVVQHPSGRGQKLFAWVPVYPAPPKRSFVPVETNERFVAVRARGQEAVVSPRVVRAIIEYALRNGWTPAVRARDFVVPEQVVRAALQATQPTSQRRVRSTRTR